MFTTLLSNLQTLISSRFLVASFFPMMAFWFAHAVMLFLFNAPFQEYVLANIGQTAGLTAVVISAALIGVAFSAYAEAALLPTIQSLMEGNWAQWMVSFFAPSQMKHYERLQSETEESERLLGAFGTTAGGKSQIGRAHV